MTSPLRVLSLIDDLPFGGGQARLLEMARTLDRDRFEHYVYTINADSDHVDRDCGNLRAEFRSSGIELRDLGKPHGLTRPNSFRPLDIVQKSLVLKRVGRRLVEVIRQLRIDVVDAHLFLSGCVAATTGMLTRVPFVLTEYVLDGWNPPMMWLPGQIVLRRAAAIITDSEARRRDMNDWTLGGDRPIHVVPNGVRPPRPTRPISEILAYFDLPVDAGPLIVQVSRLVEFKGHRVLLDAARKVLERFPNAAFLFVGYVGAPERDYVDDLLRRASRYGIADRIRIAGYPGPIGDVWRIADIHVHASLFDSLPNAIIEGMSLGKPAVVTTTGGIPELVEHERTGMCVAPGDAGSLADALIRVAADPALASRLGEAARRRYDERCSPRAFCQSVERILIEVARA